MSVGSRDRRYSESKMKTNRGRKQDRAGVAGGQDHEVRYAAKKTMKSASAVTKRVERKLGR